MAGIKRRVLVAIDCEKLQLEPAHVGNNEEMEGGRGSDSHAQHRMAALRGYLAGLKGGAVQYKWIKGGSEP
jgi:hypothetical protein